MYIIYINIAYIYICYTIFTVTLLYYTYFKCNNSNNTLYRYRNKIKT